MEKFIFNFVGFAAAGMLEGLTSEPATSEPTTEVTAESETATAGTETASSTMSVPLYIEPGSRRARRGDPVRFSCVVPDSGRRLIQTVRWSREDGRPLSNRAVPNEHYLDIRDIEPADAGRYVCTVESDASTSTAFGDLAIEGDRFP